MNEYTESERNKSSYENEVKNEKIMSKIERENECENKNRNENATYEKYETPVIHTFEKYEMSNNGEGTETCQSNMSQRYEKYGNNKDPKHNEETYACILKKNIFTEKYKLKQIVEDRERFENKILSEMQEMLRFPGKLY